MPDDIVFLAGRFALYADLMALFGLALFPLYAAPAGPRLSVPLKALSLGGAVLGLPLSLYLTLQLTANMAGQGLADIDRASIEIVLFETAVGTAFIWRSLALCVLLAMSLWPGSFAQPRTACAAGLAALALATLAWSGHAAAHEGPDAMLLLGADIAHLLAGGAWFGALIAFVWLLYRPSAAQAADANALHAALARFSLVGSLLVAVIVATGLINSLALVGLDNLGALPSETYGRLLLTKIALFGAMLALASVNRFRLTPALHQALAGRAIAPAIGSLRLTLVLEAGAAVAIVALVAWLGSLSPLAVG